MYKITLPINFDGYRYGMTFFKGTGETNNEKIAQRMKNKGFLVERLLEQQEQSSAPDSSESKSTRGRKKKSEDEEIEDN